MRKSLSRPTTISSSNFRTILPACLSGDMNSQNTQCKTVWQNVDKINLEPQDRRDPKKIIIDSTKFVAATKNAGSRTQELQLIAIGKYVMSISPNSIAGTQNYLMVEIIRNNGYQNYINNGLIQAVANSPDARISFQLKQNVLNIAKKTTLALKVHLFVSTCTRGNDTTQCLISTTSLGYSFIAPNVQKVLLKKLPQFIDSLATASSKVLPKFLGHNINFAIKFGGVMYGNKVLGSVGLIFDAISIVHSVNGLIECNGRNDNPCGNKEIRDHIASIGISGVEFVGGIKLAMAGTAMGPVGILFSFLIIAAKLAYSGISNIIEYEKKYDTTWGEDFGIFMRTLALSDMAEAVQALAKKTNDVNKIIEYVAQQLKSLSDETVAYAMGFGKVVLLKEICSTGYVWKVTLLRGGWFNATYCRLVPSTEILSDYSEIDLGSGVEKYDNKLSRILPKPIEGMRFICLPALTDKIYEKEGTSNSLSSYPNVKHYCNNAMVVEDNARMQNSSITEKIVLFNLQYVNAGMITGSDTLNNVFLINNVDDRVHSTTVVSGTSVKNHFYLSGPTYKARLVFSNDSINIVHMAHSEAYPHVSKFICTNGTIVIMHKVYKHGKLTDDVRAYSEAVNPKAKFSLYYVGTPKKRDDIHCNYEVYNAEDNSDKCDYIDTAGGAIDGIDLIKNCKKVIIRPYTSYSSKTDSSSNEKSDTRYFNIQTDGYESDTNSFANISLSSTDMAHITLSNISVLLDTKEVIYIPQSQTLLMKFLLSEGGIFTLYLEPYTFKNGVPNFTVLDNLGYIAPTFDSRSSNITHIEKFVLHAKMDKHTSIDQLKAKHQNVHRDDRLYKVFSTVEISNEKYHLGSTARDVIYIDKDTHYVFGGEAADVYVMNNEWPIDGLIDNRSEDRIADLLLVNCNISDINVYRNISVKDGKAFSNLVLSNGADQSLMVINYFSPDKEYQHLIVQDKNNGSYIPLYMVDAYKYRFIPLYHARIDKNDLVVSSDVEEFVVAAQKEDIKFYRERLNCIVLVYNSNEDTIELKVQIKDFYYGNHSVKIFFYNDGGIDIHTYIKLDHSKCDYNSPTNLDYIDSNSILDVRYTNFTTDAIISFNLKVNNGVLTPVSDTEQKLGVLYIDNVDPTNITVEKKDNDLILSIPYPDPWWLSPEHSQDPRLLPEPYVRITIKNHFVDAQYSPYFLYFNFIDYDPIRIYTFNNTADIIDTKLSYASSIYYTFGILMNNTSIKVRDLKCAYSTYNMILEENDIHRVLGFESLEDMFIFISECKFNKSLLSRLRENLPAFEAYSDILLYNVALQDYNTTYVEKQRKILLYSFLPINITNFIERLIKADDDSISKLYSDSYTEVRPKRSADFNGRNISEYNMQDDPNSARLDSSAQMSSSASKPGSWFAGVSQKISNFVTSITKVGQKFGGASSDILDLDAAININSNEQARLNDYASLIEDSNTDNNAKVIPILEYININNVLYLGIVFCAKKLSLKNSYISPHNALEIQREMMLQEVLQNLEQGMNRWDNNTYEEDCFI